MIKEKLEGYQTENHQNGYHDYIMDETHQNFTDGVIKVRNIKYSLLDKIESLYDNWVRQDPFRPLYNY